MRTDLSVSMKVAKRFVAEGLGYEEIADFWRFSPITARIYRLERIVNISNISKMCIFQEQEVLKEVKMNKLIILTFVLRGLGFVLIVLSILAGNGYLMNLFPGLEETAFNSRSFLNPFFISGVVVYFVGAIVYFFVNKQIRAERRRLEIEEAEERAFGKKSE